MSYIKVYLRFLDVLRRYRSGTSVWNGLMELVIIAAIIIVIRSSPPVLKLWSEFIGEYQCQSVISIKLQSNFIETTLWRECSPVNWLHNFTTPFLKSTSGGLLVRNEWVTYQFSYVIRHKGACGWGAIINFVLKLRKVIEFESLCVLICFSYIYLIIGGKRSFMN